MNWNPLQKPAEIAENRLIDAILEGYFPAGSNLPAERELAVLIGVTRPTLREALQRLGRDGWVEIRQGRPTRVRDYWKEGSLGVLSGIAHNPAHLPQDFIPNLLTVRRLLAPTYTRLALERSPAEFEELLDRYQDLDDTPAVFAEADLELHRRLTIASGNPVFTLILNGFSELYKTMAGIYFSNPAARASSRSFYAGLLTAAKTKDPNFTEELTTRVMEESEKLWIHAAKGGGE
jgi:GntR family negative regulator for fad regulon and positive regulator of fabA